MEGVAISIPHTLLLNRVQRSEHYCQLSAPSSARMSAWLDWRYSAPHCLALERADFHLVLSSSGPQVPSVLTPVSRWQGSPNPSLFPSPLWTDSRSTVSLPAEWRSLLLPHSVYEPPATHPAR